MNCDLNFDEYKDNFKEFSLKVTEIKDSSGTPVYLSRINEAKLIHEEEGEEPKVEEEDKKDNAGLIAGVVVAGVVVIGGTVLGILLYKRHKNKLIQNNNLNDDRNIKDSDLKKNEQESGSNRQIIPFQN